MNVLADEVIKNELNVPFRLLGMDETNRFILIEKGGVVFYFNSLDISAITLVRIAPFTWWHSKYTQTSKLVNWPRAINDLVSASLSMTKRATR